MFETSVRNGELSINASSGVAACRAFYEYVKSQGAGISSWSGTRLELPERLPDMDKRTVISPFRHHYYLNVVTFWKNRANWEFYKGFFGKEWVYSVIPNMGGKSGLTCDLEFYANGRLSA